MLPVQVMLLAAILLHPIGLSRNVCLSIDLQLIGRLKFTVILVWTSMSAAPSIGLVDTTTGRGFFDAASAGNTPAHRSITIAAATTRLSVDCGVIAPFLFLTVDLRDITNARSMPRL
jgi:hypothetical protein